MAPASAAAVILRGVKGSGPAPEFATMWPQKGWLSTVRTRIYLEVTRHLTYSPKNGQIRVGRPFRNPQAVVPAPP